MQKLINSLVKSSGHPVSYFLHGGCLQFAQMLKNDIGGEIRYLPKEEHIVLMKDGKLYDCTGNVTKKYIHSSYLTECEFFSRKRIILGFSC